MTPRDITQQQRHNDNEAALFVGTDGQFEIDLRDGTDKVLLNAGRGRLGVVRTIDAVPSSVTLYRRLVKRPLDVAISATMLILLSPVMVVVWYSLRRAVGPGVILRQRRVGRFGRSFTCYKFRTMLADRRVSDQPWHGEERRTGHKSDDDPRHTPLGRQVRKFSLDELPQLLNVLRGDMSLVGPRPEMATVAESSFVRHCRHQVRPGLTGPFQVSDLRRSGDLTLGLVDDEWYVYNGSLKTDLRLLARTVGSVRGGTGS